MLYDPKWEKQAETKVDLFALPALIAWLEQQNPVQTYCYTSNGRCLIAQYFHHHKIGKSVGGWTYRPAGGGSREYLPEIFVDVAHGHPRTFSDALQRARKALAASH